MEQYEENMKNALAAVQQTNKLLTGIIAYLDS